MVYRLDHDSFIPYYYQITQQLRERILSGQWKSGEKIPSENELAKEYEVSRPTIRRALIELQKAGFIYSEKGKGSFVKPPRLEHNIYNFFDFGKNMNWKNVNVSYRVVKEATDYLPEELAKKINLGSSDLAVKVFRVLNVDDKPLALETIFLPQVLFPGLTTNDFEEEKNLYQFFAAKFEIPVRRISELMEPVVMDGYEARLLDSRKGQPAFRIERVTYSTDDQPIEFRRSIIRGDRFKFTLETNMDAGF